MAVRQRRAFQYVHVFPPTRRRVERAANLSSLWHPLQQCLNFGHDREDMLFLIYDVVEQYFWRKVVEDLGAIRIFDVEVAVVVEDLFGGDFPGAVVLLALAPP